MSKSQNTTSEQHCIKQNEKSFIQKDLSLTELWQKGELPNGWYWVEGSRAEGIYAYTSEYLNNMYRLRNDEKIIEQVPSYEKYENIITENTSLKQIRDELDCAITQLREDKIDIKEENAQLKELLKEFELWFTGIVGNMNDKNVGEHNRNLPIGNFEYIFKEFSHKINEVLK